MACRWPLLKTSNSTSSSGSASWTAGGACGPDSGVVCKECEREDCPEEGACVEPPSSDRSSSWQESGGASSAGNAGSAAETRAGGEAPRLGMSNHHRGHQGKICSTHSSNGRHGS